MLSSCLRCLLQLLGEREALNVWEKTGDQDRLWWGSVDAVVSKLGDVEKTVKGAIGVRPTAPDVQWGSCCPALTAAC